MTQNLRTAGKVLTVLLMFFCAGCATVVTKGQLPLAAPPGARPGHAVKNVTLRVFVRTDNIMEDNASTTIMMDPELEAELRQEIDAAGEYSVTQFARFETDGFSFENLATDAAKRAMQPPEFKTDYFLDLYRYNVVDGYNNPYFVWTLLHVLSLGIIPIRLPMEVELRAELYDSKRHLVKKLAIKDSASIWSWSPLLIVPAGGINRFRSVKTSVKSFQGNATRTLLMNLARPDSQ